MIPDKMRIAVLHSFYRSTQPSGENHVVTAEVEALSRAGHDVALIAVHSDSFQRQYLNGLRSAVRVATGIGRSPRADIAAFKPDILYIHNLFPNYSQRWLRHMSHPILATLHNYRPLCANGLLFRNGTVCTLCPDGAPWSSLRYGCYRDSRLATAPLFVANRRGVASNVLVTRADRIRVLSGRQLDVYTEYGVDHERMVAIPNFLPKDMDPGPTVINGNAREGWLFVGRLSPEKGILELLRQWPRHKRLSVVGEGPLMPEVRAAAGPGVNILGALRREEVIRLMRSSVGLLLPSLWHEAFPLVYLEALACGLPVIAFETIGIAEDVARHGTGLVLHANEDLDVVTSRLESRSPHLRRPCREIFDANYSETIVTERLTTEFESTVRQYHDSRHASVSV